MCTPNSGPNESVGYFSYEEALQSGDERNDRLKVQGLHFTPNERGNV
jgi:hypothetical protein